MRRSLNKGPRGLLGLFVVLSSPACTLFPGSPWGEVEASLVVVFDPPASRLTEEGRLKTSSDYELVLERLAVQVDALEVEVAAAQTGPTTFDPSRPPPRYSLCHNGHCHHDDGRLVDYADIERELGGGGNAGAVLVIGASEGPPLELADDKGGQAVPLLPCPEGCLLERGEIVQVRALLSALEVSVRAFDRRQGEARRLPEEGTVYGATLAQLVPVIARVSLPLDGSEPPLLELKGALLLPPTLFDGVDFEALAPTDDALIEKLREDSALALEISRREPAGELPNGFFP
jgi:hypothetical protein